MLLAPRRLAFVALALALAAPGCGSNAKKIVGKWKELKDDAKEVRYIEFRGDGTGVITADSSDPEQKKKLAGVEQKFTYTVTGAVIEITPERKGDETGEAIKLTRAR